MPILLKDLLKEVDQKDPNENPLKVQIYCDMDGVLVDLEGQYDASNPEKSHGFKKLSKGLSPSEYEAKNGRNSFWKLAGSDPNFWINLEPKEKAVPLWAFLKYNFTDFPLIVLSAGSGTNLATQKKAWIKKNMDPSMPDDRIIIADKGTSKPNYIKNYPNEYVTHILVDDTQKNIDAWHNKELHRIGVQYDEKNYESVKSQLLAYKTK